MTPTTDKQVARIRLGSLTCRSQERLLAEKLTHVSGVTAASIGDGDVLTALYDVRTFDIDGLVAAIVESGLVPEEVLSASPTDTSSHGGDQCQIAS